jgi:uncharacterized membrane protein YdbT with pleckstrin-like domain
MNQVITERNYPIQNIWLFKQLFAALIILPIFFIVIFGTSNGAAFSSGTLIIFFPFIFVFVLVLGIPVFINLLRRSNFHYSLDEKFIVLHQGIISKQNRNVPYGVIQGVFLHQELFDRIFGLASLTIEDFSQGGKSAMDIDGYIGSGKSRREALGFVGNKIHIPGLKKEDAEELKAIILQKVKENPVEDSQSGL